MSDPEQLPAITQESIYAIWAAHQLGPVTQITRPLGGVRNLCFTVNERFVLRFNARDLASLKFHNERVAYERLAQQALPVPRVLVLDDSHALVPMIL